MVKTDSSRSRRVDFDSMDILGELSTLSSDPSSIFQRASACILLLQKRPFCGVRNILLFQPEGSDLRHKEARRLHGIGCISGLRHDDGRIPLPCVMNQVSHDKQ